MDSNENRFVLAATEDQGECLFSITPQNEAFCDRFLKALTAHNDLNDVAMIQDLLKD